MAPSRTSTVKNKNASKHASNKSGIRNSKTSTKPTPDGVVKPRSSSSKRTQSKGAPQKVKATSSLATLKKKRRVYTEKELGIPELNMITPVGVVKGGGKAGGGGKKGKVFVDDRESMLTILALVSADKEGQIESKMMRARQMEEIREARKAEAEKRIEERKEKLDQTKEGLRKKRRKEKGKEATEADASKPLKLKKKTVAFA